MDSMLERRAFDGSSLRCRTMMALGVVGGVILPLVAAILYSTYRIAVGSPGLEGTRQGGVVYLAGEMAFVLYRMRRGLSFRALLKTIPKWARVCLAVFIATFWISSALVSPFPAFSLLLCVGWLVQLLFAGAVFDSARDVAIARRLDIWPGFAIGLVAIGTETAIHFTVLPTEIAAHTAEIDWGSAIPGFISVRLFGAWAAAILTLLSGVAWLQSGSERGRPLLLSAITIAFGVMFWTATRAALVGCLGALPLAFLVVGPPRSRDMIAVLPVCLLAAAVIAVLLQPYGHPAFTFFDFNSPRMNGSADSISSLRLTFWTRSLAIAQHYPLFGTGAGSSWWLVKLGTMHHVQPHNMLVQFVLNWGLVPTIPALILLGGAVWKSHLRLRGAKELLPLAMMLDCLLLMGLFDGMFHFVQFLMLIVGTLALCLAPAPPPAR
jgi:hypothetical protein